MASRGFFDLETNTRLMAERFIRDCKRDKWLVKNFIRILVTCTYRSEAEQAALYAIGRTLPGRRVTKAKPGQSNHNRVDARGRPASTAFDVVPLRAGKAVWGTGGDGIDDDPSDDARDDLEVWQRIGEIGERAGLSWAGRWVEFREFPHFELRT